MPHTTFSRDAYIAVGQVIHKAYHRRSALSEPAETHRKITVRHIAYEMADMFAADNEGFERKRFMDDIGVHDSILNEEEKNNGKITKMG